MSHTVTVVVTRYKEPNDLLHATLDSLCLQQFRTITCDLTILVLDQFEHLDTLAYCAERNNESCAGRFDYIVIEPKSLSYARNYGIKHAPSDYILFIDCDAIASHNWVEDILLTFQKQKNIGVVGTKIIPKRNGKRNICTYSSFFQADYSMLDLGVGKINVPKVIGASFAIDKKLLADAAYFDEHLGRKDGILVGGEETDLCRRARKVGIDVYYTGDSYVLHQVQPERLTYARIIKRVFWGGVSRVVTGGKPEPHKISRSLIDYLLLPFYLMFYLTGYVYAKLSLHK